VCSDLQAEARVHRIGQTKEVTVIRLVTKDTVEEVILQRALRKLKLSSAVIEEGKFRAEKDDEKESPEQLFDIIQYGLRKVITSEDSTIEDDDIDAILARSEANMKNLSIHQVDEHISATQAPTMLPDEEETMELQSQSVKVHRWTHARHTHDTLTDVKTTSCRRTGRRTLRLWTRSWKVRCWPRPAQSLPANESEPRPTSRAYFITSPLLAFW
jgi:hypothetical protein